MVLRRGDLQTPLFHAAVACADELILHCGGLQTLWFYAVVVFGTIWVSTLCIADDTLPNFNVAGVDSRTAPYLEMH